VTEGHVGTAVDAQILLHLAAIAVMVLKYLASKEAARAAMSDLVVGVAAAGVEHGQFMSIRRRQHLSNTQDGVWGLLLRKVCGLTSSPISDPKLILNAGMLVSNYIQMKPI